MQYTINFRHDDDSELPSLAEVMSSPVGDRSISARSAYRYLLNTDEFPEMLPLAYQLVTGTVGASQEVAPIFPDKFYEKTIDIAALPENLDKFAGTFGLDTLINSDTGSVSNEFLAQQLTPTMHISGCWLHNLSRVATAHTTVAGILNKQYALQTMAYAATERRETKLVEDGCSSLFTAFHDSRLSKAFVNTDKTENFAFEFPLLLLSFGQFPREFLPELLGLNLAWHHFGIHSFVEKIILKNIIRSDPTTLVAAGLTQRNAALAGLALEAIETFLKEQDSDPTRIWRRILSGMETLAAAWEKHALAMKHGISMEEPDPRTAMLELIRRKSPYAIGYHRNKRLGPHKIDELLDNEKFGPDEALKHLANSPYVVQGDAAKSRFTTDLVEPGGSMVDIFTQEELGVVDDWINSLGGTAKSPVNSAANQEGGADQTTRYPLWERADYLEASREKYANRACSLRELYYKLVNVEYYPEVLPLAEKFLIDRLNRSRATLTSGERPIPDPQYSDAALEHWVFDKYRQQIDAYQPLSGKPQVSKEDFINATVRLAPLLLIDGGWLQGAAGVNTVFTPVGLKLYRVFFEEIGKGDAGWHHSNLYRDLLESMGVMLPDVTELDFAFSDQFPDTAFEVPVIWLSLSCFTRHYMPEILGLNLAVELAGTGVGYLEAHDTLKYFGFPTLFVDLHNSADNASVGHAALAVDAIKIYMKDQTEREGPHSLDHYWQRIWSGMRLTLPASSDFYWKPTTPSTTSPGASASPSSSPIFRY